MTELSDEVVERLREESLALQKVAWGRLDGGQDCSISASLADTAADLIEELVGRLEQAEREMDAGRPILAATVIKLALTEARSNRSLRSQG